MSTRIVLEADGTIRIERAGDEPSIESYVRDLVAEFDRARLDIREAFNRHTDIPSGDAGPYPLVGAAGCATPVPGLVVKA